MVFDLCLKNFQNCNRCRIHLCLTFLWCFFNRIDPNCVLNIYRVVPNCVTKAKNVRTRIFIGDQIDDCKDLSGLYYILPFQKVSVIAIKR